MVINHGPTMENTNNLKTLPLELQVDILSRLPVQQLIRLKCLSKFWHAEISDLSFSKLYQHRQKTVVDTTSSEGGSVIKVTKESVFCVNFRSNIVKELRCPPNIKAARFLCAFNGLLLFVELNSVLWDCVLYNPLTGAYVVLPRLIIDVADRPGPEFHRETIPCIGFGSDSQSDDIKILSLIRYNKPKGNYMYESHEAAYIYSMKMKSWKAIKPYPHGGYMGTGMKSNMVYCNDAVHWISKGDYTDAVISALNLGTEKYYTLPTPDDEFNYFACNLAVLKGCLHLTSYVYGEYNLWIMREYGVKQSWTRLFHCLLAELREPFSVNPPIDPVPHAYLEDGQKIVVMLGEFSCKFLCCNLQTRVIEKVEINYLRLETPRGRRRIVPWAPSFAYPC